jgi:hypothetical protein
MSYWPIPLVLFLLWLLFRARGSWAQNKIFGTRLIVEYADQNEDFRALLPQAGIIHRRIKIKHSDFFVLKLEKPLHYEGMEFPEFIIKARNFGEQLGVKDESPIHILLPIAPPLPEKVNYEVEEFEQVAWGILKRSPVQLAEQASLPE